ncbi:hypothetical protein CROQUDRAFT_673158 [Cronartium quercuum f. sp. fusiforme G11]|uniref:UDP-galactose transporter n=1 Tax=Cronartium quercuum f. sp. fusiforme G11 TaxID=708437 RepID=A0A9P6T8Y7_9BASI|nr:hypothetical protein CROQUDRAFT_673158 [Cronartium quercuum f. sp. fusiforme G11]
MLIPALLYTIQNNLLYIALSNLDTPTFLVTSQLKIISTAIFSVILFKKHLSSLQWISLVLLTIGVSLVQLEPRPSTKPSYSHPAVEQDWFKGLMAIIFSSLSSGLAGCWFESLVKKKPESIKKDRVVGRATVSDTPSQLSLHKHQRAQNVRSTDALSDSLWLKNLQLSVFTIPFAFLAIYLDPRSHHQLITRGFFSGYRPLVWSVIIYHAVGGILVSLIVKQTSTMVKSFANSLSIVCE